MYILWKHMPLCMDFVVVVVITYYIGVLYDHVCVVSYVRKGPWYANFQELKINYLKMIFRTRAQNKYCIFALPQWKYFSYCRMVLNNGLTPFTRNVVKSIDSSNKLGGKFMRLRCQNCRQHVIVYIDMPVVVFVTRVFFPPN